jgi:hypothetical protein
MPQVLGAENSNYTVLNTAGTTTLNPGQVSGPPIQPGVLFGAQVVNVGTNFVLTVVDIIPASPGGAAASTNTLLNGTATGIGQQLPAGAPGVGMRYKGALVAIVTGTPGAYNALWD